MYEIIDASGPGSEFYTSRLPTGEFALRFHHLGYLLANQEAWSALRSSFEESGFPIVFETLNPGFMDAIYIEAPELGHYLEYILPRQAGYDFFMNVPAS